MVCNLKKYSVQYNSNTWQWNVVLWERKDPLDAWQGRAVGGFTHQHDAEREALKLNEGLK